MIKDASILRHRLKPTYFKKDELNFGKDAEESKTNVLLSTSYFFGVLGFMLSVFVIVVVTEKQLPNGLKLSDEFKYPHRFIAERAYNQLKKLTGLGPRIGGSYVNDVLAVNLLKKEIENVIINAKEKHKIELDIQTVDGAYPLQFLDGLTVAYKNVKNVVVRVGSRINSPHSLLINCHFDTVADSPGGSDDGAGCAVMLEMLRVLSQTDQILRHNIIFLFNGGEENFLPAAHGFITQHKWAREVKAFINLEACGAGGREVLFQAGPNHPWILETYSEEVPYPYASSLAQEIFQSGFIPGDTDYRIFRDFGNVSGLDFAWSSNGYVYHTKFDTIDQIPLGSLQRTGDNILALARGMAQGYQLEDVEKHRPGNLVFFDFLGAFVVRWSMFAGDIINLLAVLFSLYTVYENIKNAERSSSISSSTYVKKLVHSMGAVVGTWVASVATSMLIALCLNALGRTMSWYARPLWVLFLYVVPTLLVSMSVILLDAKYKHKDITRKSLATFQIYYDAYQLIWTIILSAGIFLRIRSSFVALLWVLFPAIGNIVRSKLFKKWKNENWLFLHISIITLPFSQSVYLIIGAFYLFIPIMGRVGAGNNSELIVAVLVSFFYVILISFIVPIILIIRSVERILSLLLGIFLLSLGVLLLTPLGFPYSGDPTYLAPQRFVIAHAMRTYHDATGAINGESSGYWFANMDINSPHSISHYVPEVLQAQLINQDCIDHLYCGLPYLVPVQSFIWKTHWIPGPTPNLAIPVKMTILNRTVINNLESIDIQIAGPTHMGIMLSPNLGVNLIKWSVTNGLPLKGLPWNNRDTYFVFTVASGDSVPWIVKLEFQLSSEHSSYTADFAVTSHYLYGSGKSSKEFETLIESFPTWTAAMYWTASYESWIL